jgi:hypothetical protein
MSQPIQNVDSIDVVGVRNDTGIALVVVCSAALDDSPETLTTLRAKVRGYIKAGCSESIWEAYPSANVGPVEIYISCEHSVSTPALRLIDLLIGEAASKNIALQLVKSMA